MNMHRLAVLGGMGLGALAACEALPAPPLPPVSSQASLPIEASAPPPTLVVAQEAGAGGRVHVEVNKAAGGLDPASSAAFQTARGHLEQCHPGSSGKVNVRVTREGGSTHLHIEPGASLDPSEGHCVLEALSTVELEETGSNVGGPAVKPSGFTSLITISW
jgi:hypothetical protein